MEKHYRKTAMGECNCSQPHIEATEPIPKKKNDWQEELKMMMHEFYWSKEDMPFNIGEIETFINKLLSIQRKADIEMIEKKIKDIEFYSKQTAFRDDEKLKTIMNAQMNILDDIINALNNK